MVLYLCVSYEEIGTLIAVTEIKSRSSYLWVSVFTLCIIYKVNGLKENGDLEAEGQGLPSRKPCGITLLLNSLS